MNPAATEAALRRHLRAHNWSVLAASAMTLILSAIGWALLYGGAYWLALFSITISHNGDGGPPAGFHWAFLICAAVLLVAAIVNGWLFQNERAVDERPPIEQFTDVLLFVPRFTILFWNNLSALVSLRRGDWQPAADLLERLKTEGRVPLQQFPAQVPDGKTRARILDALSVTQLIDVRKAGELTWLYLSSLAPEPFRRPALANEPPRDAEPEMRQATLRERRKLLREPAREPDRDPKP